MTGRQLLRWLPAALAALVLLSFVVRNADTPDLPHFDVPEGLTPAPPPTTAGPGGELPALVAVGGTTTTTVPANVGAARLAGTVTGPAGAVPGATVRLERFIGDAVQVVDAVTGADGRYDVAGIGGGRYRVRAFLAPSLAQPSGEVLFLRAAEERALDLRVEAFGEPVVAVDHAPEAPELGDLVNVAVRVTRRTVDAEGVVRTDSLAGSVVGMVASGGFSPSIPPSVTADGDGIATFTFTCQSATATTLQVTARPPGEAIATATADVPACTVPAPTTTSTSSTTTTTTTTTAVDG